MRKKQEPYVTTVELGASSKRKSNRNKLLSPSERVEALPKVTLKRKTVPKSPSTQDLELKADNITLE